MADNDKEDDFYQPAKKKVRLSFAEHIDVIVGQDRQLFHVSRSEICSRSRFFEAACSERWSKSGGESEGTKTIELLDEDAEIFDIVLYCIYKDKVDVGETTVPLAAETGIPDKERIQHRLARAYVLADKLRDILSANMFMDDLIDYHIKTSMVSQPHTVEFVAKNTTDSSPLRSLFVDVLTHEAHAGHIRSICDHESVPRQFICELLTSCHGIIDDNNRNGKVITDAFDGYYLESRSKCEYHQHDDLHPANGNTCKKKKDEDESEGSSMDESDSD